MFRFVEQVKNERGCALAVMRWNQEHKRTTRFPLELDHIVPRYLGGRPAIHFTRGLRGRRRDWVLVWWFLIHPNIQVLCHTCHQAKDKNGGR
jgi:5-methylcytosine-specific restriction endonuclease McrA